MGSKRGHTSCVNLVDALGTGASIIDQARILEDAQVLRDGRPTDGKTSRKFDHGQRPFGQALQYGNARRIAQRMESGG